MQVLIGFITRNIRVNPYNQRYIKKKIYIYICRSQIKL
jgi:hypothetical protein